jgi:hypothetical protein
MAPVTVKRKSMRFLAPMVIFGPSMLSQSILIQYIQAKELQAISQDIIRSCNDSNQLFKALHNLSSMTWNFEKVDIWFAVLSFGST